LWTVQTMPARAQLPSPRTGSTMYTEKDEFWSRKTLAQMSREEWESLCDGCGRCCTIKLIDEDTEQLLQTRLACKLLDCGSCRCGDYANRHASVPDCVVLTPDNVLELRWLPETCAYRLVALGQPLAWWHPLVSGDPETVHQAGISARGEVRSEKGIAEKNYWRYVVSGK
jgi:uncharacterized cysteine cluster protein YcgN (CxxCxxCC family)